MPAYRERVYIFPEENGQPAWIVEFPIWWDRSSFFDKFGSRQIDTGNPIYVDYGLLLTGSEARAWNEESRDQFERDPRSNDPSVFEAMIWWKTVLDKTSWIIVESYEWESGLS